MEGQAMPNAHEWPNPHAIMALKDQMATKDFYLSRGDLTMTLEKLL
jgi:hypothetical protein